MKTKLHADRIAYAILLVLAGIAFIVAFRFPRVAEAHSGPGSFPLALSVLLALLAIAGWFTRAPAADPASVADTTKNKYRMPLLAGMTALYLLLVLFLGFISSTALLGMGALLVLGYAHPVRALAFGFMAAYALYIIFGTMMNVNLPQGWIG